ncbi:uncharacterized protein [Physcomitrium patens]|uniref:uncharacterized protein isoform X3 n=1 Tax=Physcomitrium patens TaxID=3218 RepID=UPI000D15F36E|nr:intraflagellar transport protein 88 homolog isoform X2 [Physcomitrium patens]|eukprot:XP_024356907.1 intraflagellar transport protein 88 homolog isoform X2 [Physcomitrella patens]
MGRHAGEPGSNFLEAAKERMASPNFCKFPPFPSLASSSPSDSCDELYEGYNDYDPQLHHTYTGPQSQIGSFGEGLGSKTDTTGIYDHGLAYSRSSSASDVQGQKLDPFAKTLTAGTTASMIWRPPSTCVSSRAQHSPFFFTDSSRPMTAIRAAGYSSRGSKFDPMNQGAPISTSGSQKKEEANPEYQCREIERAVNQLLEASAAAGLAGDFQTALQKAKEAGKKDRALCRTREQAGLADQMNMELTFAVCFNLGYQYQCGGLQSEALNTYTQIMKNKQDAVQAFELVMENKVDHQTTYNLIVCYYVLENTEQMKNCFTKMLLVKYYDSDSDDENDDENSVLRNNELREELRTKQNQALKYISTAARLIAPVLYHNFVEGYDWVVEGLKDQQYAALANEMELEKAIQHLHRRDFTQAIVLLKDFEKKEKDLKARAATNLSFLYFLEGDISNAEKHAEVAVKTNRYNAQALVNQGNCLYSRGRVEEAKAVYQEAAEVELDCVEAVYNLGLCHKRLGALGDALSTFKKLSNSIPNSIEVLFQVGDVNGLMGNIKQAIKCLEIVNTRTMHDPGVLAMLGRLHAKCDDEPKALYYYSESHRVYPANMDITSWLGAYYVKNEVYEKAMPFFDLASKLQPTEIKWQLMVASCHRRTGAHTEALAKYKAILSKHPDNTECLRYLLHMCTGLGRRDEVRTYEAQLRKAEMELASESRSHLLRLESANEVPLRFIEFRGESRHSTRDDTYLSPRSSESPGSSLFGSRVFNSNLFTSSSVSSSPLPQKTLRGSTKKKPPGQREEEVWPELGDDLLPM